MRPNVVLTMNLIELRSLRINKLRLVDYSFISHYHASQTAFCRVLWNLNLMAFCSETLKVWTGRGSILHLMQEVREHTKAVTSLAIFQSGERLYSGSLDRTTRVCTYNSKSSIFNFDLKVIFDTSRFGLLTMMKCIVYKHLKWRIRFTISSLPKAF